MVRVVLPPRALIELFERLDCLVRTGDELLALAGDADARARLRGRVVAAGVVRAVGVVAPQSGVRHVDSPLRVRGALLGHRLAASVRQRLRLLKLGLVGDAASDRLRLDQAQETTLLGGAVCVADGAGLRSRCRVPILHDEVGGEFVTAHAAHWRQLSAGLVGAAWPTGDVLVHDVGEVDPLVPVPVPVLRRIRRAARDLRDAHALRWVGADEHGWLAVARAR